MPVLNPARALPFDSLQGGPSDPCSPYACPEPCEGSALRQTAGRTFRPLLTLSQSPNPCEGSALRQTAGRTFRPLLTLCLSPARALPFDRLQGGPSDPCSPYACPLRGLCPSTDCREDLQTLAHLMPVPNPVRALPFDRLQGGPSDPCSPYACPL